MRKLDFGVKNAELPSPVADSKFTRRDALKAMGWGLAILGGGSVLLTSKPANAQQITVRGVTVETFRLEDTIANITSNSRQYQKGETIINRVYSNLVGIAGEGIVGAVEIRPDGASFGVAFPASRDRNPRREGAGTWGVAITDFLNMVREQCGSSVTRMRMLLERTTDTEQNDPIINFYAIPNDSQDRIISNYAGGVLAMVASYYPDRGVVYGGRALLLEPGVPEPDRIARR